MDGSENQAVVLRVRVLCAVLVVKPHRHVASRVSHATQRLSSLLLTPKAMHASLDKVFVADGQS